MLSVLGAEDVNSPTGRFVYKSTCWPFLLPSHADIPHVFPLYDQSVRSGLVLGCVPLYDVWCVTAVLATLHRIN